MLNEEQVLISDDTTDMENMLNLVDKEHGLVVDSQIGLLGEFENEDLVLCHEEDNISELGHVYSHISAGPRGDWFNVVDADGCILFDELVTHTFIIQDIDGTIGYIFILKDYIQTDEINSFFGSDKDNKAFIIYKDGQITTNCKQLKYTLDEITKLEDAGVRQWRLNFEDKLYASAVIDGNNNVFVFKRVNSPKKDRRW